MYHGIGTGNDLDGSDPHYAVSREQLSRHIDILGGSVALRDQVARGAIEAHCATFDDGHLSHYTNAFPLLLEKGCNGEFYVNSALVGGAHCLSWSQVRELTANGMSVQSHGHHHHYLSDLSDSALRADLDTSKKTIEDRTGEGVTILAPPGGRYDARTLRIAAELGYVRVAISRPGCWARFQSLIVPRFPVYQATADATIARYLSPGSRATVVAILRYRVMGLAKSVLGNAIYERLRNAVVDLRGPRPL
jgi:peptidoglycan/xylan/chitin deacetylase (PgdA/CDA1 family)